MNDETTVIPDVISSAGLSSTSPGDTLDSKLTNFDQNADSEKCDLKEFTNNIFSGVTQIDKTEKLGEGAIGLVYETKDPILKRSVALKTLRPGYRDKKSIITRFLKEAQLTSTIEHPNIIPIHSLGIDDEHGIFYTMKKIDGEDFQDIIDKLKADEGDYRERFSLNRLLDIFIAACHGVAYAHSKGLIHRDIKPDNIIIGDYGEVLVSDWGLVKSIDESSDGAKTSRDIDTQLATETVDGQVAGTPLFIAPEQIMNKPDYKSDQYSLGVTLYHMLTCSYPFSQSGTVMDLLGRVYNGQSIRPRKQSSYLKIPKALEAICLKAMARDMDDRYDNVNQLIDDVVNFRENKTVLAYKSPIHMRLIKLARRNPITSTSLFTAITASVIVIALTAGFLIQKFDKALKTARENIAMGRQYYDSTINLTAQLEALRKEHDYRKKDDRNERDVEEMRNRMNTLSTTHYRIAFSELQKVGPNYKPKQVKELIKEVLLSRIELARKLRLDDDLGSWVDFVEKWVQNYVGTLTATEIEGIEKLKREVAGQGTITLLADSSAAKIRIRQVISINSGEVIIKNWFRLTKKYHMGLAKGSYVVDVKSDNGIEFSYPVLISHSEDQVIQLKIPLSIPEGTSFIHEGTALLGGEFSNRYHKHERVVDSFYIKKTEVTFAEYLEFWKTLSSRYKNEYMPHITSAQDFAVRMAFTKNNTLAQFISPNMPVFGITPYAAHAYCVWKTKQTGKFHRLPTSLEWEKAARGADGREFVWGNKPSRTNALTSSNGTQCQDVCSYPKDQSLYGVFDLSGNVREYVSAEGRTYKIKGSGFASSDKMAHASTSQEVILRPLDVGFRYVITK